MRSHELVTVIFSMTASACLTLALIHACIWWQQRNAWASLLFALTAIGTAAAAACNLALLHADSPAQFAFSLRWLQLAFSVAFLALAGFVRLYLRAGRMWLLWIACGLRLLAVVLNFSTGENLRYRKIWELRQIPFLGDSVSIAQGGVPNPWLFVGQLSLLALVIFAVDAALTVWRRGDQREAVIVGGSITLVMLAISAQSALIIQGVVEWPITPSLFCLVMVAVAAYELAREALRATNLAREAHAHRNEVAHLLRVASLAELSTALAHELNQPLTAILSNAQAARIIVDQGNEGSEAIRPILDDIIADDKRAGEVISRLRLLLKKSDFQPRPLAANELIQEVIKLMHYELMVRAVDVVTEYAPDLPSIRGDRVQLQQVLINLVLNAGDAMLGQPRNARTLTLRSGRAEGNVIEITVADMGTGIPPGHAEKLFEPYHTTKAHGLGLGLSVSRSIVRAHGGRLWAGDLAQGGAAFHFTVPVWKGETPRAAAE
jgi:signal transduction histidine kinase